MENKTKFLLEEITVVFILRIDLSSPGANINSSARDQGLWTQSRSTDIGLV